MPIWLGKQADFREFSTRCRAKGSTLRKITASDVDGVSPAGRRRAARKYCPRRIYPVLGKHSKSFSLVDAVSVGVDRMQRNFEPIRKQVELWRQLELTDVTAKTIIYQAFIESELDVPRHLARRMRDLISTRSTTNSNRAPCGVFPTPSHPRLRIWNRFRSSERRETEWIPGAGAVKLGLPSSVRGIPGVR